MSSKGRSSSKIEPIENYSTETQGQGLQFSSKDNLVSEKLEMEGIENKLFHNNNETMRDLKLKYKDRKSIRKASFLNIKRPTITICQEGTNNPDISSEGSNVGVKEERKMSFMSCQANNPPSLSSYELPNKEISEPFPNNPDNPIFRKRGGTNTNRFSTLGELTRLPLTPQLNSSSQYINHKYFCDSCIYIYIYIHIYIYI